MLGNYQDWLRLVLSSKLAFRQANHMASNESSTLCVSLDTFHKPGFKQHAKILHLLFTAVQTEGAIQGPLWDQSKGLSYPSNAAFVQEFVKDLLTRSFPNLSPPQVQVWDGPLVLLFNCPIEICWMRMDFQSFQIQEYFVAFSGWIFVCLLLFMSRDLWCFRPVSLECSIFMSFLLSSHISEIF